jgi:hypothetical protein
MLSMQVNMQTPSRHTSPGAQVLIHDPQYDSLVWVSTQKPPQQAPLKHSLLVVHSSPMSLPVCSQKQVSTLRVYPGGHCATHTLLQQSKPSAQHSLRKQAPSASPQQTSPLAAPLQQSAGSTVKWPSGRQFVQKPSMQKGVPLEGSQQPLAAHDAKSSAAQHRPLRLD